MEHLIAGAGNPADQVILPFLNHQTGSEKARSLLLSFLEAFRTALMPARFATGQILPGQRVGRFRLGTAWHELEPQLPRSYVREERSGCFAARLPSMWFFVDEVTQWLTQITVLNGFHGTLPTGIGLGSTGTDVAATLGEWTEDDCDNLIVPGHPGICFEVSFVPGHEVEWQLRHAPIAYISVFRPSPEV